MSKIIYFHRYSNLLIMESLVLILNPSKSNLEKEVVNILKNKTTVNYFCTNELNQNTTNQIEPDLIFFILDSPFENYEFSKLDNFYSNFSLVPVVGILKNNNFPSDRKILYKYIWTFLSYPFNENDISRAIELYCSRKYDKSEIVFPLKKHTMFDMFKGESENSIKLKEKILNISQYDVSVLLNGETGTGKELCAKMIHFLSNRSANNFVPINCGAIPAELFENEFFGHKKGAYTNADSSEIGLIGEADNGTLFLDEIESLPFGMQVKLLRFLEEKKYKPLGQSNYLFSNVRIIAATNENLREKVKTKHFREDLFYRLNILSIDLPPLRKRQEDIPVLAYYFLKRFSELYKKEIRGIRPIVMMKMLHHNWEGNIRELQNIIQESVILNTTGWIEEEDICICKKNSDNANLISSFNEAKQSMISKFEKSYLKNLLILFEGNLSKAARFSKKDRRALGRLLKKNNINPFDFRSSKYTL